MNNVAQEQAHLAQLAATDPHKRFHGLYRLLCHPLWLDAALAAIRPNKGFNTPGADGVKGRSLDAERLAQLAEKLRTGTYRPTPVRRVFIPKRNGKLRPLGLPTAEDKVVQSALKLVLEPIYEQEFRPCSHGFRPRHSCHTALRTCLLRRTPTWTIEGDLHSFFDTIDHGVLLSVLRKKIADERLIELIRQFLKAGYLQDWRWHATWSGTPQGGVLSPLLANAILHEFDCYVEDVLGANTPLDADYAHRNPAYNRINLRINRCTHRLARTTDPTQRTRLLQTLQDLKAQRARTPSRQAVRALTYVRYADDWVLALHGYSRDEARTLRTHLADWLQTTLKLTLSPEKTLITHWTKRVSFLGFELRGIKSHANGTPHAPRVRISHDAESRVRHTVARLCRNTSIEPGDMIDALNRVLRGWMNYYCYATNPHRVFARVLHHAFWCLVRYVNKRHRRRGAKKALRRYYGTVRGKKTFVYTSPTTGRTISLIRSLGRKSLYQLTSPRPEVDDQAKPWPLYSAAVGRSPWQRAEVRQSQGDRCAQCGEVLTEVHHRTALKTRTNPTEAGYAVDKIGLCHACHVARTAQQRASRRSGKAGYSETGPSSLREHGGETYAP